MSQPTWERGAPPEQAGRAGAARTPGAGWRRQGSALDTSAPGEMRRLPTASRPRGGPGRGRGPAPLTGRGAVLLMLVLFGLGLITAAWLQWPAAAGISFLAGSAAAARYARPAALPAVAVSPPLLFFILLVCVNMMTATGDVRVSGIAAVALTLAEVAPWLFAGTVLCLAIAWFRGLPQAISQFRGGGRSGRRPPPREHARPSGSVARSGGHLQQSHPSGGHPRSQRRAGEG